LFPQISWQPAGTPGPLSHLRPRNKTCIVGAAPLPLPPLLWVLLLLLLLLRRRRLPRLRSPLLDSGINDGLLQSRGRVRCGWRRW
jgi:hypothetical protein